MLRIVASSNNTSVTTSPPAATICPLLSAGQFCDIRIQQDHVVTSNNPLPIGHFLLSVIDLNDTDNDNESMGDPSAALVTPTEQFLDHHTFSVPLSYANSYVAISAFTTSTMILEGVDISSQAAAFGNGFRASRQPVEPGQHSIECSSGCAVLVYGLSAEGSSMYGAGQELDPITP